MHGRPTPSPEKRQDTSFGGLIERLNGGTSHLVRGSLATYAEFESENMTPLGILSIISAPAPKAYS